MIIPTVIFIVVTASVFLVARALSPATESFVRQWEAKRMEKITPKVDQMFLDVPLKKLMLMDVASPIVCALLGLFFFKNMIVALACGGFGFAAPFIIVKKMEAGRRKKFAGQLVDGLLLLSSSLKAGLSLMQAFEALIEEMPAPLSQEFSLLLRQVQMGVPLEDAMYALKKRMKVDELDMVVTAIMVARETGGNLTEIFSQVATTIQERNKLIGRVNALCVQGKLQGVIMSVLPLLFGAFVYKVDTHFFDIFLSDSTGRFMLGYAIVSQIIGVFFIRKFSTIDV